MRLAMRRKWALPRGVLLAVCLAATARAHPPTNTPTNTPVPTPEVTLPECDANDPTLQLPDMQPLTPSDIRVVHSGGHRLLLFSTAIANTGDGPLILKGTTVQTPSGPVTQANQEIFRSDGSMCSRVAGYFEYHPTHRHWHFQGFESYELWEDAPETGTLLTQATKTSFCLIDVAKLVGYNNTPQFLNSCGDPEGTEGIDVGFADVYDFLLPGQSIDLDANPTNPIPPGTYFLTNTVNPDKNIWEKNYDNDVGTASVRVIAKSLVLAPATSTGGPGQPHQSLGPVLPPRSRFPHAPHDPHQAPADHPQHAHTAHSQRLPPSVPPPQHPQHP